MIPSIILGVIGGFVLAMPPGPISIAATRQVLAGFWRAGLMIILAASLMDMAYMLIATFASSAIILTFQSIVRESKWFLLAFQAVCIGVLLYLGFSFLVPERRDHREEVLEEKELKQEERAKKLAHSSPFLIGILMAVTNLASPTFFPSLVAFVGFLHANQWLHRSGTDNIMFSVGFGGGTMLWFVTAMRVLSHFRSRLPDGFINGIYRFAGGTMLIFAAVIAYHAVTTTEWITLVHSLTR